MHYVYSVTLETAAEVGGFVARLDDVPKIDTQGDDFEHVPEQAEDSLVVALNLYVNAASTSNSS